MSQGCQQLLGHAHGQRQPRQDQPRQVGNKTCYQSVAHVLCVFFKNEVVKISLKVVNSF